MYDRHRPAVLSVARDPRRRRVEVPRALLPPAVLVLGVCGVAVALGLEPELGSAWWTIGRVGSLQPSWLYDYRLLTPRWDRWSAIVPTLAAVVRAFKISERIARMRV